jgi:copper transport protein
MMVGIRIASGRLWWAIVGAVMAVVLVAGPAGAHSSLARSDPPDGGSVAVGRTELGLWFTEPVVASASRFTLRTDSGAPVSVTMSMPATGAFVQLDTRPLHRGVLVLTWDTVSADDGHPGHGSITFGVGMRPALTTASPGGASRAPQALLRWLQLTALMIAVGAVIAPGLLRRASALAWGTSQQAIRLGTIASLTALAATMLTPLLIAPQTSDLAGQVVTTRWGVLWLIRMTALTVSTAAFARLLRAGPGRAWTVACGAALVVAAASDAAAGHSAELPRASELAVIVTTVHVVAAGAWFGTLVVLSACLVPLMRLTPALRRPLLITTWRAFTPVAAVSAASVVASGLYLAGRQLPDLGALTGTWYGAAALGKALALLAALVVAASTTRVVNPRLAETLNARLHLRLRVVDPVRFPRLVAAELALVGVAVVLASVMTTGPTVRAGLADATPTPPQTGVVDGLFVSFEMVPAGPTDSRVIVLTNAVTRPQPGPITRTEVLMVPPGQDSMTVTLRPIEAGRFEGTARVPSAAALRVWVTLGRPSAPDAVAAFTWSSPADGADAPPALEVTATMLAAAITMATAIAFVLWQRRRRSSRAANDRSPASSGTAKEPVGVGTWRAGHED